MKLKLNLLLNAISSVKEYSHISTHTMSAVSHTHTHKKSHQAVAISRHSGFSSYLVKLANDISIFLPRNPVPSAKQINDKTAEALSDKVPRGLGQAES